ncbi:ATP-binding protein [bacterium]|nr:ATP-binding protein [bacterium]
MFLSENLQEKWSPILEHSDLPKIEDNYKRAVTAVILENQEKALNEDRVTLDEAAPLNATGSSAISNWDPILISLVRRAMPNLVAYDICGVQPMTGPTGLIFAMKARYNDYPSVGREGKTEALFNEADTGYSNDNQVVADGALAAQNSDPFNSDYATHTGAGMSTASAEALGDVEASNGFAQMAFSIEKATVTAKSRALKAEYTLELAQDLKAIHGLDAESELANILSSEILAEINREVIRNVNIQGKTGASATASAGTFNLDVDANGRWSVEKFKGLLFQIERESNVIAKETRRGKGNFILCSSDVASALSMAGVLDYTPALSTNLNVDDTGNTFAGVLNGRVKVYIDPYAGVDYLTVGYRGSNPYDAGLFYCPYVPLQMVRAVGENTFQPKIGFKTRYGMVSNPFVGATPADGLASAGTNQYYRKFAVSNIL